jgi:ATP-dependent Clp protease protease subunit
MIHRSSGHSSSVPLLTKSSFAEPSGGASGQASDIAIHAKEILRVRKVLTEIYQRHCGQDSESADAGIQRFGTFSPVSSIPCQNADFDHCVLETALERDYFMTAPEALSFGIVDSILQKRPAMDSEGSS